METGKSGARNLEAESIGSRAESTGGCVKLKTAIEVRRSSTRDTFIAECVDTDRQGQSLARPAYMPIFTSKCSPSTGKIKIKIKSPRTG